MAVAAPPPQRQVGKDRDQVQGTQHMAAGGAVAPAAGDLLPVGNAPGHAVDKGPEDRSQHKGEDQDIGGQDAARKDEICLETSCVQGLYLCVCFSLSALLGYRPRSWRWNWHPMHPGHTRSPSPRGRRRTGICHHSPHPKTIPKKTHHRLI